MKAERYHSALAAERPYPAVERWEDPETGSVALVHDICDGDLPPEFDSCDVFFTEPPWPAGFETFQQRAGVDLGMSYRRMMQAAERQIRRYKLPTALTCGKQMLRYLAPDLIVPTIFDVHRAPAFLAVYYLSAYDPEAAKNSVSMTRYLARRFNRLGDFFCGYGQPAEIFALAGKTFVAADFNPRCIGCIATEAGNWR